MFRNRAFNISILISLGWHIFWISMVTIITVPTGLSFANYTKVYFLGPILKKTAFEFMLENSPVHRETLYRYPVIPPYTFEVKIESPIERPLKQTLEYEKPSMFKFSLKDIIKEDKVTTSHFFKETFSVLSRSIGPRSPIGKRAIIFKPDKIPRVPIWITQDQESFKIKLEFTVSPQGNVKRVKPIVSSGYPQVDMIGMDYLKRWRFAPLQPSDKQKDHAGNIKIELRVDE